MNLISSLQPAGKTSSRAETRPNNSLIHLQFFSMELYKGSSAVFGLIHCNQTNNGKKETLLPSS